MSTQLPSAPEALRVKKQPWLNRLWVRIFLIVLLINLIALTIWWLPRRGMIVVWRVNGELYSDVDRQRAVDVMPFLQRFGLTWRRFGDVYRVLSWTRSDSDITTVCLQDTAVNDQWLVHLKQFPEMKWLNLHDRQIGPGLEALRDSQKLTGVGIHALRNDMLSELCRLPQIEDLNIWSPESKEIELDVLAGLPKLKSLLFDHCPHTDEFLKRLPELPQVETLVFQSCQGFSEEGLAYLQRMPNLKWLDLLRCAPVDDAGLMQLARLRNLETLAVRKSSGRITETGLQALQQLKDLKQFIVIKGDLAPEQIKMLEETLPDVWIRVH